MNRLQSYQSPNDESTFIGDLIDNLEERFSGFLKKVSPREKRFAPHLPFADSITLAANSFGVLNLKGPTKGRFWYVRKLRISGVTPVAVSSSSEYTFSGGSAPVVTLTSGGTLNSISFLYTTDATPGNRTVVVTIVEPNNRIIYQVVSPYNQPPSTATEYSLAVGVQTSANGAPVSVTMPLPANLVLPAGAKILITAQGSAAGDTTTTGTAFLTGSSRADVFVCPDDLRSTATLAQCPITSWRDQFTLIPDVKSYGVGELRVSSQEGLYVAVSNGALASQSFVASCEAYEWPDIDENVEWVI